MKTLFDHRPWENLKLGDLVVISDCPGEVCDFHGVVVEKEKNRFWVWWTDTENIISFARTSYDEMFFVIKDQ